MFCAKCGKELEENVQHCPHCGAVILHEEKTKKKAKIVIGCVLVVLILVGACVAGMWYGSGGEQYIKLYYAKFKMKNGEYASALSELEQLGQLKNAKELVKECEYQLAIIALNENRYLEARQNLNKLGDYKESKGYLEETYYMEAQQLMEQGQYENAIRMLGNIGNYGSAEQKLKECHYKLGELSKNAGDYETAIEEFTLADDYLNASQMKTICENKKKQLEKQAAATPVPTQKPTPKPVVKEKKQTVPATDPFETERYYYFTNSVIESTNLGVLLDYYISYGKVFAYEGEGQLILSYENGEEQNITFRYDNNGETNYPFSLSIEGDHLCVTTEEGNRLYFWEEKMPPE